MTRRPLTSLVACLTALAAPWVLTPARAHAQPAPSTDPLAELLAETPAPPVHESAAPIELELLREARALDGRTEYPAAAARYEDYARRCLASPAAELGPAQGCADAGDALERAFHLRLALGHPDRAEGDARAYVEHFLYAHPRAALELVHGLTRAHVAAGRLDRAQVALELFVSMFADPPAGQAIVADALRARIAARAGEDARAARHWRRVEQGYERGELTADGPVPAAWIREAVAEGRLLRAERSVARFLAVEAPRSQRFEDPDRWWARTMSPWLVRTRRRLLLARMELERVYELGSPRHSVIAAARIGEMYGHQAELHEALALPDDEWIRTLVHQGSDRPGYDEARTHLQTCVTWASHHGVAPRWASRCEEGLHHLDPVSFPVPAELHGRAGYQPVSLAIPVAPRR